MDSKTENTQSLKHRRSIRLKNYDYSSLGLYFVTICTHGYMNLLGEIKDDKMNLNKYGEIAKKEWYKTGEIRPDINLPEFVIMPNHLHGIIEITCRGTLQRAHEDGTVRDNTSGILHHEKTGTVHRAPTAEKFGKPTANSIPSIVRSYKAVVTKQVRDINNNPDYLFWQRSYYEHIIRNEESYLKIAEYILNNPKKWYEDKYYG